MLEEHFSVWAVDVFGWGFTNSRGQDCGPLVKTKVLLQFLRDVVAQPCVVAGASLGGAMAIDAAVTSPETVRGLVLIDAQGFQDGLGLLPKLPEPITKLALEVLRSDFLRQSANEMSYFDKETFATRDALQVSLTMRNALPTGRPDALVG